MRDRLSSIARGVTFDVTIVGARYGGTYEGAKWIAWPGEIEWLDDHQSGDNACIDFWQDYAHATLGRGSTPDEALADLVTKAQRLDEEGIR